MNSQRRISAFTLVELLVVIAIIAMFVAALMPAIQAARSTARQMQCKANMTQLVMAIHNYEMAVEHFPAGVQDESGPIQSTSEGLHHSWLIAMLPYLDESTIHQNVDLTKSVYEDENKAVRQMTIPVLQCPSASSGAGIPASSYAGCHHDVEAPIDADNHGVMFLNSKITTEDVRDGLSQTLLLGERVSDANDLGWMSGTRATLRNTGTVINIDPWKGTGGPKPTSVGGFSSRHGGGAHVAFVDGRVQFLVATTSGQVLQQLGHREDGKLLDPAEYRD